MLQKTGYQTSLVSSQTKLDSHFGTVLEPNPEQDTTFQEAKNLLSSFQPDLIVLNDGDGDRMRAATYCKNIFRLFSGNEIALIFTFFLLHEKKKKGTIYCSYVSTPLIELIAQDFGCSVVRTATGFGNLANVYSQVSPSNFVLAFEETLGFLVDLSINYDKDALQASLLIAEITTFCLQNNTNLFDYLAKIYDRYGYCFTQTNSYSVSVKSDFHDQYQKLSIGTKIGDFTLQNKKSLFVTNSSINSLFFLYFDQNCSLAIRNSQTEPVGKVYFFAHGKPSTTQKRIMKLLSLCTNN